MTVIPCICPCDCCAGCGGILYDELMRPELSLKERLLSTDIDPLLFAPLCSVPKLPKVAHSSKHTLLTRLMICMEDESMYDGVTVCPPAAVGDSWNVSSSSARTSPHPCTLRFAGPIPATSTLNRLRRNSVVGKTGQGRARERGEESGRRRGGTTEVTKHNGMDGDEGSGSARPDEWGSAVASGDATKLAELVLLWSGSKPERALSILRSSVSLLEKEVAFSAPASSPLQSPPTTPGPTRNSCLEALIVALNETCDGTSWYTSTKELQLASLEFCIACRNYQTVHLNVDEQIPRRLLATADAPPPHPKRLCWTRVPRLRARRVTWNMPTAAELRTPIFAMTDVEYLEFGDAFEDSLEAVPWPEHLRTMEFHPDSPFDQPIELVQWPAFLQKITFGADFNQPIERVKFPASLQQLIFRTSSSCFDQPIAEVVLPASLQLLELGGDFNQPIEDVVWPASLQQLTFGNRFNHPIEGTVWPDALQTLVFGVDFNQPVDNARWPASLQELTFGWCDEFAGDGMVIFSNFNQPIGSSVWPASLRRLTLGHMFRQSLQGLGTWMPNLEALHLLHDHGSWLGDSNLLCGIEWPKGLRHLTLLEGTSLDGVDIPFAVQVLFAYHECW